MFQNNLKSYIVSSYDYNLAEVGQISLNEYQNKFFYVFSVYNDLYEEFNI